jgi:hypothetical protein
LVIKAPLIGSTINAMVIHDVHQPASALQSSEANPALYAPILERSIVALPTIKRMPMNSRPGSSDRYDSPLE